VGVNRCIIPVAGYGTRFLPVTKSIPKELIPILNKPLLQYSIEECYESEIKNIDIVTSKHKKSIQDFLDKNSEIDLTLRGSSKYETLQNLNSLIDSFTFKFFLQEKMLGLGHAISMTQNCVQESCAVILPDDLCLTKGDSVLRQLMKIHEENEDFSIVAVEEVDSEMVSKYGIVSIDSSISENGKVFKVNDMVEKPSIEESPSNLAIIGRYILNNSTIEKINQVEPDLNGEIQITNALKLEAKEGRVLAYKFDGIRFDCGSIEGFVRANNAFFES